MRSGQVVATLRRSAHCARARVRCELCYGRKVAEVAADLEISEQSIYTWRRQARIDAGFEPGLSTAERAELVAAKRRIRELETEVAVHRRATELLKGKTHPK